MTITVNTSITEDKIIFVSEDVTIDLPSSIKGSIQKEYDRLSPTDIANAIKAENVRKIHEAMVNLGLTVSDL